MTTKPAFQITRGRGFQLTFPNGYTVSVQFGYGNYTDNTAVRNIELDTMASVKVNNLNFLSTDLLAGQNGANTAETAVMDPNGDFVPYTKDGGFLDKPDGPFYDVQGHMDIMSVVTLIILTAALPPFKDKSAQAPPSTGRRINIREQ